MMTIAIVGAGAMGGVFGGKLAEAGVDVILAGVAAPLNEAMFVLVKEYERANGIA